MPLNRPTRRGRLPAPLRFPQRSLAECETLAWAVWRLGGRAVSSDAVAQAVGYRHARQGGFRTTCAAARTFGLLVATRDHRLTLAWGAVRRLAETGGAWTPAIRQWALCQPPLFRRLVAQYAGGPLPPDDTVATVLQSWGLAPTPARTAAERFRQALEWAEAWTQDGTLRADLLTPSESGAAGAAQSAPQPQAAPVRCPSSPSAERLVREAYRLALRQGGYVELTLTGPLTARDARRLSWLIDWVVAPGTTQVTTEE